MHDYWAMWRKSLWYFWLLAVLLVSQVASPGIVLCQEAGEMQLVELVHYHPCQEEPAHEEGLSKGHSHCFRECSDTFLANLVWDGAGKGKVFPIGAVPALATLLPQGRIGVRQERPPRVIITTIHKTIATSVIRV